MVTMEQYKTSFFQIEWKLVGFKPDWYRYLFLIYFMLQHNNWFICKGHYCCHQQKVKKTNYEIWFYQQSEAGNLYKSRIIRALKHTHEALNVDFLTNWSLQFRIGIKLSELSIMKPVKLTWKWTVKDRVCRCYTIHWQVYLNFAKKISLQVLRVLKNHYPYHPNTV